MVLNNCISPLKGCTKSLWFDYRQLNEIMEMDANPLPIIGNIIETHSATIIFSTHNF